MRRAADDTPGAFEIMVAYDNLSPLLDPITIGVENAAGDMATALVNNTVPGAAIANGTVVCFNRVAEGTAQLSYQAEVVGEPASADGYFSNEAVHSTSELGSRQETAIGRVKYSDVIFEDGFEPSD